MPTLMVSTIVEPGGEDDDLADAIAGMAQSSGLEAVGERVVPELTPQLQRFGVALFEDRARAKHLANVDFTAFNNKMSVLSGTWADEDGMIYPLYPESPFKKGVMRRVAESLDSDVSPEGFAYISLRYYTINRWFVLKQPVIMLSVVVSDDQGEEVMRLRTYGRGLNNPFVVNRSAESLGRALDGALSEIGTLEVKEL